MSPIAPHSRCHLPSPAKPRLDADPPQARVSLSAALRALARNPLQALVEEFNWKTAAVSAILRAVLFFFSNLRAGHNLALRATLVEACYAVVSMGVFGAITERIRDARPAWLTGLLVWLAIPGMMLTIQYCVHRSFGTPELRTSMIASFCFAGLGTGFSWYAMRRGAMMVGDQRRSFAADMQALPGLLFDFVAAVPRALLRQMGS